MKRCGWIVSGRVRRFTCPCGREVETRHPGQRYCSVRCRNHAQSSKDAPAFAAERRALGRAWRAEGRCPHCGEPAAPGRVLCARHLERYRERARQLRREAKARGLCQWLGCDRPAVVGGWGCEEHAAGMRAYRTSEERKARERELYAQKRAGAENDERGLARLDAIAAAERESRERRTA